MVDDMEKLTEAQLEKYYCSTFLKEIGEEGQLKLLNSKVLVIGAGGLASSTLLYLATSGIGKLGVVDNDVVSLSNLPRQILYAQGDVGKAKVDVAKKKLEYINPDTEVTTYKMWLDKENAEDIIKDYDIVLDCVDNFETKFLINDICRKLNKPFISAGVSDYKGQIMTVTEKSKSDFKSLFSTLPVDIPQEEKDKDQGVFSIAVGIISNIQCAETLKYLLGIGDLLIDKMLIVDSLKMEFQKFEIK